MEASENPQLPLDEGPGGGIVRALDDRLVIADLTVSDKRAARVVRERAEDGAPATETVTKAIEIGARLLEDEGTVANVDYVRRELEAGLAEVKGQLGETVEDGAEALTEQLTKAFGLERSDSVQAQIKEIVVAEARQHREALMSSLTAEDPSNPLVGMQVRIGKAMLEAEERHRQETARTNELIGKLKEELARANERHAADERVAEAEEAGTRKGRTFEELVHAAIEEIATGHDDVAHHTGDESSEAGGKMGDTVVEIGGALGTGVATVVFESKNKKLSKNDAWTELNGCMAERDAAYAVLVVAGDDKVPSGLEELTEYQGNKMIVVLDREDPDPLAIRLVYRYVRARLLVSGDDALEVDAAGVRDAAEEAAARLKRANRVRKSLTAVTNGADAAREEFDEMVTDVERCLARIEALVARAALEAAE